MPPPTHIPDPAAHLFHVAPGRLVTTRDLLAAGHTRQQVSRWARAGLCEPLLHGVWGHPVHDPAERRLHLPQAYLDLRRGATHRPCVLTGAGALEAHGVPGLPAVPPTVLVDRSCTVRRGTLPFRPRRTDLCQVAVEHRGRLRLRTPAEAVADAASEPDVDDDAVRHAVDHLRNRGLLWLPDAVRTWTAMRGSGARTLMRWVRAGVFEQESDGERDAFRLLLADDEPRADCQVVIVGKLRVDFVYLSAALIIEYYGYVHDGRADADATRLDAFEERGYRVKVVTKSMLRDAPRVRAQIQALRRQREDMVRTGQLVLPTLPPQPERVYPLRTHQPGR